MSEGLAIALIVRLEGMTRLLREECSKLQKDATPEAREIQAERCAGVIKEAEEILRETVSPELQQRLRDIISLATDYRARVLSR